MPSTRSSRPPHRVVIVGGGAGGLELAAQLGRAHGPACVTLVDVRSFHIWKPSLHETAAGTLDIHQEGLSYLMLAHRRNFSFVLGRMTSVDRDQCIINIDSVTDDDGEVVLPARAVPYDTLVLALGSIANVQGTPGAAEHAVALECTKTAERFRLTLLKAMIQVDQAKPHAPTASLNVVIVGGGATGVELAVELHEAAQVLGAYGLPSFRADRDMTITLLEGANRLLPLLPEGLARAAHGRLTELGIKVQTGCRVTEVTAASVKTAEGAELPAGLCLWSADIQGPAVLAALDLPLNHCRQLEVNSHLETEDPRVLAFGDCAAAPWRGHSTVPASAQAAHQQAAYLVRKISMRIRGLPEPATPFVYRDRGSLGSLARGRGLRGLMGKLAGRGLFVSGTLARFMYMTLHLSHHRAALGTCHTLSLALARMLMRRTRLRVKLH
jgi:NADH dehydrogenase